MTVLELVDRERKRLRWLHLLAGIALAVGATALLLAVGASVLGSSRWMSLPRPIPFLVWLIVLAADAAIVVWTVRRLDRRTTRQRCGGRDRTRTVDARWSDPRCIRSLAYRRAWPSVPLPW